jgi:ribonuclease D
LLPLAHLFEKDLQQCNRLSWVREECLLQSRVRPGNNDHEPLYLNFKGAGSLPPRDLAVLEAILQLRKVIAEKKDRPLFKIFQNGDIAKIVQCRPSSPERLLKINALSFKQYEMYGNHIIDAIKAAEQIPKEELPRYPRKRSPKLRIRDQERIRLLKKWKDQKAGELGIESALVLNKVLVSAIVAADPRKIEDLKMIKEMKNWQIHEFGEEILFLLKEIRQEKS